MVGAGYGDGCLLSGCVGYSTARSYGSTTSDVTGVAWREHAAPAASSIFSGASVGGVTGSRVGPSLEPKARASSSFAGCRWRQAVVDFRYIPRIGRSLISEQDIRRDAWNTPGC